MQLPSRIGPYPSLPAPMTTSGNMVSSLASLGIAIDTADRVANSDSQIQGIGGGVLGFSPGAYRFQKSITILSDIQIDPGAYLYVDAGVNVAVLGEIYGPISRFIFSGPGTYSFVGGRQSTFRSEWFGVITVSGAVDGLGALVIPPGFSSPFAFSVANRVAFNRMVGFMPGQNGLTADALNQEKACILRPTVYAISTAGVDAFGNGNSIRIVNRKFHILSEYAGEQFGPPRIFWFSSIADGGQNTQPLFHYAGMPAQPPLFLNATGECIIGGGIEINSFPEFPDTNTFCVVAGGIPDGAGGITAVGSAPITAIRCSFVRFSGMWGAARVINCGSFNMFRCLLDGVSQPFSFEHGCQEPRIEHCRINGHAFAPLRINAVGIKLRSDGQPCAPPILFHFLDNEMNQSGLVYGGILGGYCGIMECINDANNPVTGVFIRGNVPVEVGNRQFSMLPGADPKSNYLVYGDNVSDLHFDDNKCYEWNGATTHFQSLIKIVTGDNFYMNQGNRFSVQHTGRMFDLPAGSRNTNMLNETVTLATNTQFALPNVGEGEISILETQSNLDFCKYLVSRLGTPPVVIDKQNGTNYSTTIGGVGYNLGVVGGVVTFENKIGSTKTFRICVTPWLTLQ